MYWFQLNYILHYAYCKDMQNTAHYEDIRNAENIQCNGMSHPTTHTHY